ncbi:hypothetical protein C8T65DRAFT_789842 [Cerioporus squamosus]|nr:hypothetical protein C8T65DRAFT_789842 [Cerioporus squamosus]
MSSDADTSATATVALVKALRRMLLTPPNSYTENYCDVAASVLFIYEVLVTLDREVACFWTARRRSGASLLFLANKWISMTVYIMELVGLASFPSDQSCSWFAVGFIAIEALQFVPWAVFSALRAYVLSRSKLLGLLILALSLAPVGANLVVYGYQLSGENFPPLGCILIDNATADIDLRRSTHVRTRTVIIISRVPLVIADVLLIYITWAKLSTRDALRNIQQAKRLSLSDILLRDGTIYFIVLFILNDLHLVFSLTVVAGTSGSGGSDLTIFTSPITAILVSRFLLELQEANQTVVRLNPDDPLHSSRDPYDETSSFISSLGAFINPSLAAPTDENAESLAGSRSDEEEDRTAEASMGQAAVLSSSA